MAARTLPGQIATLIIPADVAWTEGGWWLRFPLWPKPPLPAAETIEERAAAMLRSGLPTAILISGNALYGKGLAAAGRIATAAKAKLFAPYPLTRLQRGAGIAAVERIQYVREMAVEQLKDFRNLILVGAQAPIGYFAQPGKDSVFTSPECEIFTLANPGEDYIGALEAVESALSSPRVQPTAGAARSGPSLPRGEHHAAGASRSRRRIVAGERDRGGRIHDLGTRHDGRHQRRSSA